MRKSILFLLFACFMALSAGAQEVKPDYTILVGQSIQWKPGNEVIKSVDKSGDIDCVRAARMGRQVSVKGLKAGLVMLTATFASGKTAKCLVRVVEGNAQAGGWKGHYELKYPANYFHVATRELKTGWVDHAARIDNIYALVTQHEPRIGTIYSRFDFKTRRGYQASALDPEFRYTDECGDDNDWDFERYFKDFAPKDPDKTFPWALLEFGIVTTGEDEPRGDLLQDFHTYGWPIEALGLYYVGDETFLGIRCWKFDTRQRPPSGDMGSVYWVDPSNGLLLKRVYADGTGFETVIYDLDYHTWTPDMFPEMK